MCLTLRRFQGDNEGVSRSVEVNEAISCLVCSELFDDSKGAECGCPENMIILSAT